jgi:hypothetical protein
MPGTAADKPDANPRASDNERQQGSDAQQQQQQQVQLPTGEELEALLMAQLLGVMQSQPSAAASTPPLGYSAGHMNSPAGGLDIFQHEALLNLYLQNGALGTIAGDHNMRDGVQGLGAGWLNTADQHLGATQLLAQQLLHASPTQQLHAQPGPSSMLHVPQLQHLMQGLAMPKAGSMGLGLGVGPEAVGRTWEEVSQAVRERVEQVVTSSGGYIRVSQPVNLSTTPPWHACSMHARHLLDSSNSCIPVAPVLH